MHEERTKMKDQITRLEELVDQKKLADRDALSTQLKDSNLKILELQKLVNEAEKKLEMVDRNLNTDNKYLRGKINAMEKERELLADQLKSLEENVKVNHQERLTLLGFEIKNHQERLTLLHRKKKRLLRPCLFIDIMPFTNPKIRPAKYVPSVKRMNWNLKERLQSLVQNQMLPY